MLSNGAPPQPRNGSIAGSRLSLSGEPSYHHVNNSGNLKIPNGLGPSNGASNGPPQMTAAGIMGLKFEGPRSPPGQNGKNTAHVPCKFFRQGACQAGTGCPFSHDLTNTTDNICKYFAKGNCKFGPKCANIHVLPNGQRVNYHKGGMPFVGGHLNIGGRVNPDTYHGQTSALTNSIYRANITPTSPYGLQGMSQNAEENFPPLGKRSSMDLGAPTIEMNYSSQPTSAYGSPREEAVQGRFGMGLTPAAKTLGVLDAPLPASFDSDGISWFARHGPVAASVPSKFGLDSPTQSLTYAKDDRTSEALKNLHSSAFGDDVRDRFNGVAASPPGPPEEEYFGKRLMHSHRFAKQKIASSSLPKSGLAVDKDWEADFTFEEDYLPDNLKELLTPQEKARRGSRNADEEARDILTNGAAAPGTASSKFGSPSNASPSRWGPLFQRQQREEEERVSRISAFGHVGSPLRNSTLHPSSSPSQRPSSRPASGSIDTPSFLASPPRQSSMSIISQQLQRTRLSRAESSGNEIPLHPHAARLTSNPVSATRRIDLDRQISSSSIGTNRYTTPIDEENGDFVFSMEEEEDREREKRNSGSGWTYPVGGRPNIPSAPNGHGLPGARTSGGGIEGVFGAGR